MDLLSEKTDPAVKMQKKKKKKGCSATETAPNPRSLGTKARFNFTQKEIITRFHNSFSISCFSLMYRVRCNIFFRSVQDFHSRAYKQISSA